MQRECMRAQTLKRSRRMPRSMDCKCCVWEQTHVGLDIVLCMHDAFTLLRIPHAHTVTHIIYSPSTLTHSTTRTNRDTHIIDSTTIKELDDQKISSNVSGELSIFTSFRIVNAGQQKWSFSLHYVFYIDACLPQARRAFGKITFVLCD
jgi:hypothetical protein